MYHRYKYGLGPWERQGTPTLIRVQAMTASAENQGEKAIQQHFVCLCFPDYGRRLTRHLRSKPAPPRWTGPLNYEPNKPFLKLFSSGSCQQAREVTKTAPEKQKRNLQELRMKRSGREQVDHVQCFESILWGQRRAKTKPLGPQNYTLIIRL